MTMKKKKSAMEKSLDEVAQEQGIGQRRQPSEFNAQGKVRVPICPLDERGRRGDVQRVHKNPFLLDMEPVEASEEKRLARARRFGTEAEPMPDFAGEHSHPFCKAHEGDDGMVPVTEERLEALYAELKVPNPAAKGSMWVEDKFRLDTLLIRGLRSLTTNDVFKCLLPSLIRSRIRLVPWARHFAEFRPTELEWLHDDAACLGFAAAADAAKALLHAARPLKRLKPKPRGALSPQPPGQGGEGRLGPEPEEEAFVEEGEEMEETGASPKTSRV